MWVSSWNPLCFTYWPIYLQPIPIYRFCQYGLYRPIPICQPWLHDNSHFHCRMPHVVDLYFAKCVVQSTTQKRLISQFLRVYLHTWREVWCSAVSWQITCITEESGNRNPWCMFRSAHCEMNSDKTMSPSEVYSFLYKWVRRLVGTRRMSLITWGWLA